MAKGMRGSDGLTARDRYSAHALLSGEVGSVLDPEELEASDGITVALPSHYSLERVIAERNFGVRCRALLIIRVGRSLLVSAEGMFPSNGIVCLFTSLTSARACSTRAAEPRRDRRGRRHSASCRARRRRSPVRICAWSVVWAEKILLSASTLSDQLQSARSGNRQRECAASSRH
jgi:hypothetical protein